MAAIADRGEAARLMGRGEAGRYTPTRRLREGRGWSQERLAGLSAVTVQTVRKLERGAVSGLTALQLVRVARALGCSVLDLVPGFAVREAPMRGAVVADGGRRKLEGSAAAARKVKLREWLVALLRSQGGRMAQCHVWAEFEPYGLSRAWLNLRRVECGIRTQREPGFGNRVDAWVWVLSPEQMQSSTAAPESPGGRPPPLHP